MVRRLLTPSPAQRPTATALRADAFFNGLDLARILATPAPFVPAPASDTDTSYFAARPGPRAPSPRLLSTVLEGEDAAAAAAAGERHPST